MKKIIILLSLIPFCLGAKPFYELTHYNVANFNLKSLNIDDEQFLLYGSSGGVMSSTDAGKSWEQKFSGIFNNISKIIQVSDKLYGITDDGEFIVSDDRGDHWNSNIISENQLIDLVLIDNKLIITQIRDSVMISDDFGNTWESQFVVSDTLYHILEANGSAFIRTLKRKLYTNRNGSWESFNTPDYYSDFFPFTIINSNKRDFFYSQGNLTYLDDDYNWINYDIKLDNIVGVVETGNTSILFRGSFNIGLTEVRYFDTDFSKQNKIEIINQPNLTKGQNFVSFISIDNQGNMVAVGPSSSVFIKKLDESQWDLSTSFIDVKRESFRWSNYSDEENWNIVTNKNRFLKTTDAGTTFEAGEYSLLDTFPSGSVHQPEIKNIRYVTQDSIIVSIDSPFSNLATSNDGGMTFKKEFSDGLFAKTNFLFAEENDEYYSLTRFVNDTSKIINTYFIKQNLNKKDTLFILDSTSEKSYIHQIKYNNRILIYYPTNYYSDSTVYHFYLTDTDYKNPKKVYEYHFNNLESKYSAVRINNIFLTKKNELILDLFYWPQEVSYTYKSLLKLEDFDSEPEVILDYETIYFYFPQNYSINDKDKLITLGKLNKDTTGLDFYFAKLDFSNGFDYEIVGESDVEFMQIEYTLNNDTPIFYRSPYNLWRPIEPDRLISDIKIESPTLDIWAYNPYPNPSSQQISVSIYTEKMNSIKNLKVKLINITTGVAYKIENFNLVKNSNWEGKIQFDISRFQTGPYLISLDLEGKTSSKKIIINR